MDKEYLANIRNLYNDGKYLEINFLEFAGRCGGEFNTFKWLYDGGRKFCFKPVFFKPKDGNFIRAKSSEMIIIYRNLKTSIG